MDRLVNVVSTKGDGQVSGERILVVDDSKEVRDFLAGTVLVTEGYIVDVAANGKDGLRAAIEAVPDLIITDQAMPEMTGIELVEHLQKSGLNIPTILMTAEGSEEISVRALRAGVADYFIKPFDPEKLLESVHSILSGGSDQDDEFCPADLLRGLSNLNAVQLVTILHHIQEPVLVIDPNGKVTLCNLAARELMNKAEPGEAVVGRALLDITNNRSLLDIFQYVEGKLVPTQEIRLDDGRVLDAHINEIENIGRVIVMQDITHLQNQVRLRNDLVTTISHDLRSPLTSILGCIELMGKLGELNTKQKLLADQVRDSVRRITGLISELLEHHQLETGIEQPREPVLLWQLVRGAAETLAGKADMKKQHLLLDLLEDDLRVMGTPSRLQHVFSNLIDNAIKYTPEGGEISIRIRNEGNEAVCTVSDTGIGIPPEDQPHIFDRFYRTSHATSDYEGTGLGLSIVKTIVEQHDGRISVDSRPDQGTTFTVVLPINFPDNGSKT
ncbi:MAG: response regulator [Anaerolineae bacterium]|nr:response regulator [Anaerolineae bacterium]